MAANLGVEVVFGPPRRQFDRSGKLAFRSSSISSVGGLLLHRELDDALGLNDTAAALIGDPRTGKNGRYCVAACSDSLSSRVLSAMRTSMTPTAFGSTRSCAIS